MELLEERVVLRRQMLYPPELRAHMCSSIDSKLLPASLPFQSASSQFALTS
jgi:hypothetical protein